MVHVSTLCAGCCLLLSAGGCSSHCYCRRNSKLCTEADGWSAGHPGACQGLTNLQEGV